MVKTVSDKQLSEKIKELLKNAEVDESVITEVVAEINDNEDDTDADGDKVDLQDSDKETEGEGTETEGQSDKGDDSDNEGDSDDNEVEDEEDDDGDEDDEGDVDNDDEGDSDDNDDGDEDDKDDVGEGDIGDEEVEADPLAMLEDPKFRQGFDLGYKFRFEMEKLEKMEVGDEDPDEEDEKEEESDEPKEEVKDSDKDDEDEEEKSIIAQDSIEKIKQQVTAEVTASFKSRMEAGAKVKPLVGTISDVMAFDSAEEIYGFALKQNGVDVSKYKKDAYAGMVDMMLQKNDDQKVNLVIGDSVPQGTFGKQIDGAFARLKNIAN